MTVYALPADPPKSEVTIVIERNHTARSFPGCGDDTLQIVAVALVTVAALTDARQGVLGVPS